VPLLLLLKEKMISDSQLNYWDVRTCASSVQTPYDKIIQALIAEVRILRQRLSASVVSINSLRDGNDSTGGDYTLDEIA